MSALRWFGIGLAVLLLVICAALTWIVSTQSGAVWLAGVARDVLAGKLTLGEVRGTLAGPLTVNDLRYRDPKSGLDVRIARATVDVAVSELLARTVRVESAAVEGLFVGLSEREPPEEEKKPFSLTPPIDVIIDRFTLQRARIERDGTPLLVIDTAKLTGEWTQNGLGIGELDVRSPQGVVRFSGGVDDPNGIFVGEGEGSFRWKVGQLEYAGTLKTGADRREASLNAKLTSPFAATAHAIVVQKDDLPWRLELRVPSFDPRRKLAPKSTLTRLAASLNAKGDKTTAEIRGDVSVDDEQFRIDPLRVAMQEKVVKVEAFTLRDARRKGMLSTTGTVRLDREPFDANLVALWRDVEIPELWAGQPLATRGGLTITGNPDDFKAAGQMAFGPPKQLADVDIAIAGSKRELNVEQLSIVQKQGHFTAAGRVLLQPRVSWKLTAEAQRFDPGAFLADWPGKLGFQLTSEGRVTEEGPSGSLLLSNLAGTLRGRSISGQADLTLSPPQNVAGSMRLRSGGSVVDVEGKRGESLDVLATFDVASLDDWIPDTRGGVNGRFQVTGRWPDIAIAGKAAGRGLALGEHSARAVDVNVDIASPLHPKGSVTAKASDLHSSGFDVATLDLRASGSDDDHTVELTATGNPLSTEVRVQGKRLENGWSGSVQTLVLAVTDMERLALRQPAQVTIDAETFSVSESCLQGNQISICLAAQQDAARELQARYVIEKLPLGWAAAIAKPDLPVRVEGMIEGRGEIRRSSDGALFGDASLTSQSGSVSETTDGAEPLLSYQDFQLRADLNGDAAQLTTQAGLGEGSNLSGEVSLADLRDVAPSLQGKAQVNIGDLAPIALFVPQLAAVKGRATGEATLGGTINEPAIKGSLRVQELQTELPLLGILLRDGNLEASIDPEGIIGLSGRVISGDGKLDLKGSGRLDGTLDLSVTGSDFVAANIPAAYVVIEPELAISRVAERVNITGGVRVPRAAIDVTKLPQGSGAQSISPDVVVIDDETPIERSRKTPIYAEITVQVGRDVQLKGFGLEARLGGQLVVTETPGTETLGAGEVLVEGKYQAWGQDLTIERGRLMFASSPLNNPQLDITANRKADEVTAKLNVTGTAREPVLTVSADPVMSQTEALSYLLTGKPLNQLGRGEGDMMQSASQSLQGAAGNLLARSLGRRLGIDEMGVEQSAEIGGSAFTIGEYLSPRLFLSYGVGLFEPGQVVTLRYELSSNLFIEASQGPQNQRAGINYRIER